MMKQKYLLYGALLLAIIGIILISGCIDKDRPPQKYPSSSFLHVQGKKVVDENGNEIFLRGFNTGSFNFASYKDGLNNLSEIDVFNDQNFKHFMTERDIKEMRNMGANVLRAHSYLKFWTLETEPYQYDEGFIKTLDDLIDMAYRNGIYVIIVMSDAGHNDFADINVAHYGGNVLWTDNNLRKRVVAAWGYIAKHYANNPGVAGYDIINEPQPPNKQALHSFYSDVIKEIRKHDKKHMIILEHCHFTPNCDEIDWGGTYNDNNLMLQIHVYDDASKRGFYSPSQYRSREELEEDVKELYSHEETKSHPVFVGEFGATWASREIGIRWTKDVVELMNQYDVHYAYFPYKGSNSEKSNGLYWGGREWWLRDWTAKQRANLQLAQEQRNRLLTSNYERHPDYVELRQILEDGFKNRIK